MKGFVIDLAKTFGRAVKNVAVYALVVAVFAWGAHMAIAAAGPEPTVFDLTSRNGKMPTLAKVVWQLEKVMDVLNADVACVNELSNGICVDDGKKHFVFKMGDLTSPLSYDQFIKLVKSGQYYIYFAIDFTSDMHRFGECAQYHYNLFKDEPFNEPANSFVCSEPFLANFATGYLVSQQLLVSPDQYDVYRNCESNGSPCLNKWSDPKVGKHPVRWFVSR